MLALALSNTRYMYGIETLASIEDAATLSHRYRSVKVRYCLGEKWISFEVDGVEPRDRAR